MIKRFFEEESKSPIKDFLLWLLVYPFVIAFAVACVAFIFSFSLFRDVKITDWISSISTAIGVCVAWVVAKSWKEQKLPDVKIKLIGDLIEFGKVCYAHLNDPEGYLKSFNKNKTEIAYLVSIIDVGFNYLRFFDSDLSQKLVEKISEFDIEFDKLFFNEDYKNNINEIPKIFCRLINLNQECEDIILVKNGSS